MHCAWRYLHENVVVSSFRRISCERCIKKLILFLLRCCACFEVCSRYSFHFSLLHTNNLSLSLLLNLVIFMISFILRMGKKENPFSVGGIFWLQLRLSLLLSSLSEMCVCVWLRCRFHVCVYSRVRALLAHLVTYTNTIPIYAKQNIAVLCKYLRF